MQSDAWTGESREIRLRKLKIRSWRRGTKEMDLILGPFADSELIGMDPAMLGRFEALLGENDQELYQWVSGSAPAPDAYTAILADIRRFHRI